MKKWLSLVLVLFILLLAYRRHKLIELAVSQSSRPEINFEEMEIYQSLYGGITDDSSLEEMLESFEEMSEISVDSSTNMFLYEVYSYENDDGEFLACHIVRQVDEPGTDEFIQLHLDIVYPMEDAYTDFSECIWFDNDPHGFLNYIRKGEPYQALINQPIYSRNVSIDST